MSDLPVSFDDVERAASLIDGVATRTPALTSRTLNGLFNCDAWFKCENFQRTGAFKFRGAYNALVQLSETQKRAGVLTYSSGNHAQAIALACRLLDISATIVMPSDAPAVKLAATRSYGAEIIEYDRTEITREELGRRIAAERDLTLIPPYDHADVIAGQGTVAVEFLDQAGDLDVFVAPCGGGGLLSGCGIAIRNLNPDCRVIGVEPTNADDAARSFRSQTLQTVHNPDTIADGARTPYLGNLTFPIVMATADDVVTVPDEALIRAMRFLWTRMKLVVEPTGALPLAALFESRVDVWRKRVGIVISGGNIDLEHACRLFASCPDQ